MKQSSAYVSGLACVLLSACMVDSATSPGLDEFARVSTYDSATSSLESARGPTHSSLELVYDNLYVCEDADAVRDSAGNLVGWMSARSRVLRSSAFITGSRSKLERFTVLRFASSGLQTSRRECIVESGASPRDYHRWFGQSSRAVGRPSTANAIGIAASIGVGTECY